MYHFVNFRAPNNTLNSTFIEIVEKYNFINTKNSKIAEIKSSQNGTLN